MKSLPTSQQLEDQRLKFSRIRLALAYAISMALSLCLVLAAGYWIHSALVKQSLKTELQQLAEKEAGVHLIDLQEWAAGTRTKADVQLGFRPHRTAFYYILSNESQLVHGNETQPQLRPALLELLKNRELPTGKVIFKTLQPENEPELRLALLRYPVVSEGEYLGSVYAATDVGGSLSHLDHLLGTSLALALGFVLLASIGGWWMADRSLQPLRLALQHQRQFIADASHELRAPLTVMTTALALINKEAAPQLSDFHQQTLADALDETRRLNRMAEELLLLARADAGGLQPRLEPLLLTSLVEQRLRLYRTQIEHKQLELKQQLEAIPPIQGDADLLNRLLTAALDNALQYTPVGEKLIIRLFNTHQGVVFSLCNTGICLTDTDLKQVFKRFYRGDPARQRHHLGAGLGLAMIREIMLAHGGKVKLKSHPDQGTCLICIFPHFS